jgi:integrase/recombinase XerD
MHPLESLIQEYLSQKDITKHSMELYRTILKQYTKYLQVHQIHFAKTTDVMSYLEWKRSFGYSSQWMYHQISTIKGLYQYLRIHCSRLDLPKEFAFDITEAIPHEKITPRHSKAVLTIDQAKQLLFTLKNNRKYIWHYRDYAIVYLMITSGLRSVEIRRARKKDIRKIQQHLVLYVQGKGKKSADEFVKLSTGVQAAIQEYLSKRTDKNPYLFVSHSKRSHIPNLSRMFFNEMFKRVLRDAGLDGLPITPHGLRHTAATLNLLRGASLEDTKAFMRHSHLSSTLIYAHNFNHSSEDEVTQMEDYILRDET